MNDTYKPYNCTTLDMESLVGRTVAKAEINAANDYIILYTDTGKLHLTWEGDCCAHCFLAHISGTDALLGGTILSASNAEWSTINDEEYGVLETMGTTIKTTKGTVTFESRLEHNGYYGGNIVICKEGPVDQYSSPRDVEEEVMKPLEDF